MQQYPGTPDQPRRWNLGQPQLTMLLIGLVCGFILSSCDNFFDTAADLLRINPDEVEAQEDSRDRVESRMIDVGTLVIEVSEDGNATPMDDVQGEATIYTMQSTGEVRFMSNGSTDGFDVESGDKLIFRPGANTLTLIRVD